MNKRGLEKPGILFTILDFLDTLKGFYNKLVYCFITLTIKKNPWNVQIMGRCNGFLSLNLKSPICSFFLACYTARAPISFMKIFCWNRLLELLEKWTTQIKLLNGIKVWIFFEKNIEEKHLCHHDKNYCYFWKSFISVINLIVDSKNMIKLSKTLSL